MSQVDDWAEAELAWKLADALSPALPDSERAQLYAVIGSGDSYTSNWLTQHLGALPMGRCDRQ